MGMIPTKISLQQCSLTTSDGLPCERPALLKAYNTLLSVTLLKDFTIFLELALVRGLMVIQLECHPVKGFTVYLLS